MCRIQDMQARPFSGFIDFIVNPTLNVLGDVVDAILKGLEEANKKQAAKNNNNDSSSVAASGSNPLFTFSPMRRPWKEHLECNRAKWQSKQDCGRSTCSKGR